MTASTPHPDAPVNDALDLVLDRFVDVPPALVYRAWSEPEHLKPWFCPKPWRTTECEIDLRPGGRFRTVMEGPAGERHDNEGCWLEIVPERRLVWTGLMTAGYRPSEVPAEVPAFTCVLTFEAEGKGTRYHAHVMHRTPAEKAAHVSMGFSEGWSAALDQLVALLKAQG
jgi:uncharacterized protein YndB with AHSA1/START domain